MTHTLRLRLILSMLALLVPTVVIAGWLLLQVFGNRLLRDLDVALEEEATTVAALLEDPASADNVAALVARIADETDLGPGKQVAVLQGERVVAEAPPGAAAAIRRAEDLRIERGVTAPAEGGLTVAIGLPATAALNAYRRLRAFPDRRSPRPPAPRRRRLDARDPRVAPARGRRRRYRTGRRRRSHATTADDRSRR